VTYRLTHVAAAMSVTALGAAAPALAQDYNPWSGLYLGGNIGGSWGHASLSRTVTAPDGTSLPPVDASLINSTNHFHSHGGGVTGGIEGGYNWTFGPWLLGVETDFVGLDTGTTYSRTLQSALLIHPPITYSATSEAAIDWEWTLRPRLGYSFGPWLMYATVGLAVGNLNMSATITDNRTPQQRVGVSHNGAEEGFAAGGGIGYAFTPAWSMKAEYLYSDFGSLKETRSNGFGTLAVEAKSRPQVFRVGVDYHFGYVPPPVVSAPYVPPPPQPAPRSYMVFFDFDKSDLTPEAVGIVDTAAANAVAGRVTQITVTGHTDTVGSDAYNMRLSRRRAESVATELESKGVPSSAIALVAKGKRDLLVPTKDGVREPQNRRVEIVYSEGGPTS
jgi:outer membrane protein OmpA-like peptidoglycan-associated protein